MFFTGRSQLDVGSRENSLINIEDMGVTKARYCHAKGFFHGNQIMAADSAFRNRTAFEC